MPIHKSARKISAIRKKLKPSDDDICRYMDEWYACEEVPGFLKCEKCTSNQKRGRIRSGRKKRRTKLGVLCMKCYVYTPRCIVDGCENFAVIDLKFEPKCRDHLFEDEPVQLKFRTKSMLADAV